MSERPLLVLVDGHAVAYRAYFALRGASFSTKAGEPTNAVYGFTRVILDILDESPDYFAISFDAGLSGREETYPEYKANRDETPEDLKTQIERIQQLVKAFNIPVLRLDGYEADDVIGTVTKQAEEQGCRIRIVTGDRDILQLVTEHTHVQLPKRGEDDVVYDIAGFAEKYPGLKPLQLIDLKGLMGDSSDNIPGVKGIGEKTGLKLLQAYDSLEGVYEHIDEIKGSQQKKLIADRDLAFLSKDLATIKLDIPITLNLDDCVTHDYDPFKVDEIFQELEFRTHRRRLKQFHKDVDLIDNAEVVVETTQKPQHEVVIVDTEAKLTNLVEKLNAARVIAFDTETTGINQMGDYLVGIALAVDEAIGYYIPVGHVDPNASTGSFEGVLPLDVVQPASNLDKPMQQASLLDSLDAPPPPQLGLNTVIEAIRPALTNPDIEKMAHNAKYDLIMLRRYGIDVQPITYDTMLAAWLLDPEARVGLKDMALNWLNVQMTNIEALIGKGRNKITMARADVAASAAYATADVVLLFPLREKLDVELKQDAYADLRDILTEMEMPLMPIIADIEMHGVLLNVPFMEELSQELEGKLQALAQDIYADNEGREFNINSSQQVGDVLFNQLRLSPEGLKKTKTGHYSLRASTLDEMSNDHPIIPKILNYRQFQKLKNTYVDALPALINPHTGRIHTSYNQTGTTTGRFSSSDPNLQNIPIRTEEGRQVRKAFIAPEGYLLLAADYSQVELRILAHFSGDEALIEAFRQGQDIHASTAAAVHRIPLESVTYEQRSFAKAVNFGLMYGMGAYRLSRDSDLTLSEARDFIEAYFERFPGVKAYLDQSKVFAQEQGYVKTLMGRRRNFAVLSNYGASAVLRQRAEREAINMPIQGTAADILKIAMLRLQDVLNNSSYRANMILQVHDELVLEVAESDLEAVAVIVRETMQGAATLDVPLKVEAAAGKNWYDMLDLA